MPTDKDPGLLEQLATEARAMVSYSLSEGLPVPPDIVAQLDRIAALTERRASAHPSGAAATGEEASRYAAWLARAHANLSRLVAPARPGTLALLRRERRSRLAFLGPVPAIRWLMLATALSLAGFIVLCAFGAVHHPPPGELLASGGWPFFLGELFILCAAGMGASLALLYELQSQVAHGTYEPSDDSSYVSSFLLGLLSGFTLAAIKVRMSPTTGVSAEAGAEAGRSIIEALSTAGLAFLGGFATRLTYSLLVRVLSGLPAHWRSRRERIDRTLDPGQPPLDSSEPTAASGSPVPAKDDPEAASGSGAPCSDLSDSQLQSANSYNAARSYGKELWRVVQTLVGANADGVPGSDTARKVAAWQAAHGEPVDGKVGPTTLSQLGTGPIFMNPGPHAAFFWSGGESIDADGAPNAYNPDDDGIDRLANAGKTGSWWGLAVDGSGKPYVQGASDPCPGYYVSTTALVDGSYKKSSDPRRYIDSTQIPYFVLPANIGDFLPGSLSGMLHKGDVAAVAMMSAPDQVVFAIYADVGPKKTLTPTNPFGEGSIKLSEQLGHDPYVKQNGKTRVAAGIDSGVIYVVFPGTGDKTPLSADEIDRRGQQAFAAWGGPAALRAAIAKIRDAAGARPPQSTSRAA